MVILLSRAGRALGQIDRTLKTRSKCDLHWSGSGRASLASVIASRRVVYVGIEPLGSSDSVVTVRLIVVGMYVSTSVDGTPTLFIRFSHR